MNKKYYVYEHPYVYIVLEHEFILARGSVVHGVYTTREIANNAVSKIASTRPNRHGYLSVLKKPIKGPSPKYSQHWDYGTELWIDDYNIKVK